MPPTDLVCALCCRYSVHHDVWAHPTLESLQACDYSSAVQLAGQSDGGGCQDDADLSCIAAGTGYTLTPTQDEMYLSCSVHDHCENGQRLVVKVLPAPCPHDMAASTGGGHPNSVLARLQQDVSSLVSQMAGETAREARQDAELSDDEQRRNRAILLVEGVFGVLVALLVLGVFACIALCCVFRYSRGTYNAMLRRGGGGAVPSFNRLETEMTASSAVKEGGAG